MAGGKLYIYDSSSSLDRSQAAGRFSSDSGVVTLPVASVAELHLGLATLLTKGQTFTRVLFQTHGDSGMIYFNNDGIGPAILSKSFTGYTQLFPGRAKLYFDGCNVADGAHGWEFLEAAGKAFLRTQGGITMGFTSLGGGMPGWLPWKGGHTIHLWGDLRFIDFKPGAVEKSRFSSGDASIFDMAEAYRKLESF